MIKPLKEWTVKEIIDFARANKCGWCKKDAADRCPFKGDGDVCESFMCMRYINNNTLDIYAESGGSKYARDN